jgi:hypothetical protein
LFVIALIVDPVEKGVVCPVQLPIRIGGIAVNVDDEVTPPLNVGSVVLVVQKPT